MTDTLQADLHRIITSYLADPKPTNLKDTNTLIYAAEQHYLTLR